MLLLSGDDAVRRDHLVDDHGVLIAGHGRVRAAAKLGLASIPVMVARGWSEEEKRRPAQNLGRPLV